MPATRAVCTVLLADYEPLGAQPVAAGSDLPFICFTDDPELTSDCWEIRTIDPAFPRDAVRSARRVKALLHEYAPEFTETLFIDNAITLRARPEDILDAALADHDLAFVRHSYRESVAEEFAVVADDGLDDPARVFEQLLHYRATWPAVLDERPYAAGFIARRSTPEVVAAMRTWYDHQLRYSRRDQLSLNAALARHGLPHATLDLDNADNPWFRSAPPHGRRGERRVGEYRRALEPPEEQVRAARRTAEDARRRAERAETDLAEVIATLAGVQAAVEEAREAAARAETEVAQMQATRSWRLTAPLRRLRRG